MAEPRYVVRTHQNGSQDVFDTTAELTVVEVHNGGERLALEAICARMNSGELTKDTLAGLYIPEQGA